MKLTPGFFPTFIALLLVAAGILSLTVIDIEQGWPDFFVYGPNFFKILYCGPQKFFFA